MNLRSIINLVGAVALLVSQTAAAWAQDLTVADLIKGEKVKLSYKLADLPADYKAISLKAAKSDGLMDIMTPFFSMAMLFGGAGNSSEAQGLSMLGVLETSWTKGELVRLSGADYLVTYKPDVDIRRAMASRSGGMTNANGPDSPSIADAFQNLALTLVKMDTIVSFTAKPDVTKESMMRMVAEEPQAKTAAQKTLALSNMKQVGLGMLLYVGDYDDVFPYVQGSAAARALIVPYTKNAAVFQTGNPSGGEILFNLALAGSNSSEVANPAETVMFYERNPWPTGERMVAFADGHAKAVPAEDWPRYETTLRLRLKKSGRPLPLDYLVKDDPLLKLSATESAPPTPPTEGDFLTPPPQAKNESGR